MKPPLKSRLKHRFSYRVLGNETMPHLDPVASELQVIPDVFATGFSDH